MLPLIAALVNAGLPLLAGAVMSKGRELVEERTGIKLPDMHVGQAIPPEQVAELARIEKDRAIELDRLANDRLKIDADDRASARAREMAVRDLIPGILAVGVSLGFFGVLGYMLKFGAPKEGGEALMVMLGALGASWGAVMNYYFGSSKSSADKTALLARQ
jgi:hypothetical protein